MPGAHGLWPLLAVESNAIYYAVLAATICAGVGYFIGELKDRAVLGAALGFVLNLLGLVVIALLPRRDHRHA